MVGHILPPTPLPTHAVPVPLHPAPLTCPPPPPADGLYLYRHILPPSVPNLAFVGSEINTFNSILTAALQVGGGKAGGGAYCLEDLCGYEGEGGGATAYKCFVGIRGGGEGLLP